MKATLVTMDCCWSLLPCTPNSPCKGPACRSEVANRRSKQALHRGCVLTGPVPFPLATRGDHGAQPMHRAVQHVHPKQSQFSQTTLSALASVYLPCVPDTKVQCGTARVGTTAGTTRFGRPRVRYTSCTGTHVRHAIQSSV